MLETYQSSSNNLLLNPDQFVDAAYTPSLLGNHGTGSGRGARLELLDEEPTTPPVADRQPPPEDIDRTSPTDIDLHAPHADMDSPTRMDQRPGPASLIHLQRIYNF
jgi:hypothetical protein